MGSSISAIYDDYEDYEAICRYVGAEPVDIRSDGESFYHHQDRIVEANGLEHHNFRQIFRMKPVIPVPANKNKK